MKVVALLPVVLIVGALLNVGGVAATQVNGTQQNGPYQSFWEILVREGQLVVQLNDSPSESTASELVLNSRAGEENAANISAGIWKALVELERSGVKLYYSEDELREMADEIASKGLPNETVSELRSAGWTDEEIRALQEYIAEQRNHIEGGFNMKYFLDSFAKAFISVGWKYASYEAWAIKKGWWRDLRSPPTAGEEAVNPYIGSYRSVASAISGRNSGAFLSSVKDMRKELYHLLTESAEVYYPNGGIAFRTVSYTSNGRVVEIYYWPNALDAYRELSRLYTLAAAISNGYSTDEMWDVASQEILELGRLMTVRLISSSHSSNAPVPYYLDLPSLSLGSAPYLTVDRVEVTVSGYSYDRIFYRILVHYTVHGSAVMVQNVTISSGDRRYYLSPGILYSGPGVWESGDFSIPDDSPSFKVGGFVSVRYGPGESPGGAVPTGGKIGPRSGNSSASYLPTGSLIRDALAFYHEDLYRVSPINPANVNFTIKAVRAGSRVRYEAQLYNSNELPVSGVISLYSEVPDGNYLTVKQINVTHVALAPSDNRTVYLGTVDYSRPGSYEYFGIFRFFNYSESDNGEVLIPSPPSPVGSLRILDAKFSPDLPKEGETVTFHVTVQSAYHLSSSVNLMLYIDGQPVGETSGTIGPDSTKTFSMRWFAEAGTHSYRITAYSSRLGGEAASSLGTFIGTGASAPRVNGGGGSNSINGTIRVSHNYQIFGAALKVFPREVAGGGTVYFTVEVRNYESETLSLVGFVEDGNRAVIKRIGGLEGRIPANSEKNITFSYTVYGVGEHAFKLFLDNYDGKPNGYGAENWSKTTVEVKPSGNVIASMECMDSVIPYDGSTTCEVTLLNTGNESVSVSVTSVDFGTVRNAWGESYQRGIEVKPIKITLPPYDDKEIDVKIDLRKLAQDFWGNDHFTYKFAEHTSYQVTVHFDTGTMASSVLTIKDVSENQDDPLIVKAGGVVGGILGGVITGAVTRNPQAAIEGAITGYAVGTATTWAAVSFSWKVYAMYKGIEGIPGDGDNNAVVGG